MGIPSDGQEPSRAVQEGGLGGWAVSRGTPRVSPRGVCAHSSVHTYTGVHMLGHAHRAHRTCQGTDISRGMDV